MVTIRPLRPSPCGLPAESAPVGALHHGCTFGGYKAAGRSGDLQLPEQQLPTPSLKTGRSQYGGEGSQSSQQGMGPFPSPHPTQDQAADKRCGCGRVLPIAVCALASCPAITAASPQEYLGQAASLSLPISSDKPAPNQSPAAPSKQPGAAAGRPMGAMSSSALGGTCGKGEATDTCGRIAKRRLVQHQSFLHADLHTRQSTALSLGTEVPSPFHRAFNEELMFSGSFLGCKPQRGLSLPLVRPSSPSQVWLMLDETPSRHERNGPWTHKREPQPMSGNGDPALSLHWAVWRGIK